MKLVLVIALIVLMAYSATAFDFEFFKRDATCDREFGKCKNHLMNMKMPKNPNDVDEVKRMCRGFVDACLNYSKIPSSQNCGGDIGKKAAPTIKQLIGACREL